KEDQESKEYPLISTYAHLSPRQLNIVSEKYTEFCQLFYSKEFRRESSDEKPFIFIATGIPIKSLLEFLNQ
ncbi:MAG: hypothetical protein ACFFDN_41385, partial [Candidatus Hodarchaeota archaeon]